MACMTSCFMASLTARIRVEKNTDRPSGISLSASEMVSRSFKLTSLPDPPSARVPVYDYHIIIYFGLIPAYVRKYLEFVLD